MADLLDRVLREIRERKERARAAVEESQRLEAALAALDDQRGDGSPAARPSRRRQGAARAPRGANRAAVLGVVSERPGVSVGEVSHGTVRAILARTGASANGATPEAVETHELAAALTPGE